MPLPSPQDLLERFRQAMLDFSADALADLFSVDAVYEFPFLAPQRGQQRYEGREQIRAGFTRAWSSVPESPVTGFRDVRIHQTADPEVVVAEHKLDGVDRRSGTEFSSAFLLVLRARDGQIVHVRDYADVLAVSKGLGTLPALFDALRDEPPAYVLSEVRARDDRALDRYRERAAASIAAHGGRSSAARRAGRGRRGRMATGSDGGAGRVPLTRADGALVFVAGVRAGAGRARQRAGTPAAVSGGVARLAHPQAISSAPNGQEG